MALNKGFYYTVDDELFISTDGVRRIKVGAEGQIFVSGLTDNTDPYVISIDSNNQLHKIATSTLSGATGSSGTSGTSGTSVAVSGTTGVVTKFTSSTTIGNTVLPVTEVTGGTKNTLVFGASSRTSEDAIVEINGTSGTSGQGFMFPRMTENQRGNITQDIINRGLIVYQTDGDEGLYIYKSGGWVQII